MSKECLRCNEEHADSATKCECGYIFTDIVKTEEKPTFLQMTDLKSGKVIKITGNCTIGRNGDIETEFFAEDKYISQKHCKVVLEKGEFNIEYMETTNPTKINGNVLTKAVPRRTIRTGDCLTIADKKFEISICSETAMPDAPGNNVSVKKTIYVVKCRVCDEEHEVSGIDERIKECRHCDDEHDKCKISKEKAKPKVIYAD
jgi:pSer/pThr/pTyr-binding forkhead associated (FHA) protein